MADKRLDLQTDQKAAPEKKQTIGQKTSRPDGAIEDNALDGVSGGSAGGGGGAGRGAH